MSHKIEKALSLTGQDFRNETEDDLRAIFSQMLNAGMHGICFSPYLDDQGPGCVITEEQIRRKIEIIKPYTQWIRVFSCTEGNEMIPRIAKEYGLKTLVGAWLGEDHEKNAIEIEALIQLANEGLVDLAAVGNEVLYREELTEEELLNYIHQVKKALPNIQVGYVDAYYEFCNRPALTEACDVIFANCYPFWEGCHIDYSFLYIKEMYRRAVEAAKGKQVIISESGWPNMGSPFLASEPSFRNAVRYFINIQKWCKADNIDLFYFSSFDEAWKMGIEGDVGAYWGLWDKDGNLKYS